ncbi:MAG TPA: hypothetical protein VI636_09755 [Candidatus Angelobacter sp.]
MLRDDIRGTQLCPSDIADYLLTIGGTTPFGEPMWRLVVAGNVVWKVAGGKVWDEGLSISERGGFNFVDEDGWGPYRNRPIRDESERLVERRRYPHLEVEVKTPTDQEWNAVAAKQQREMGGTFDKVFSPEAYGEGVRRMHRKRNETAALMARVKPAPWSVINMMPFPLNVNGVLHSHLARPDGNQVDACPVGSPYVHFVIKDVQYSIKDEGAGMDNLDNYTPMAWDPSILAQDYTNEFLTKMGCGGVITYEGDHKPESTPGLKHKMDEARKERNRWLLRKVQEAEADWGDSSGRGRKNITELHRKAAEILLYEKILKQQPEWLLVASSETTPDPCPGCGEIADRKAAICKNCRYVYNPLEAFKSTLIEYGHIAMDRLSTEDWQEANKIKADRARAKRQGQSGQRATGVGEESQDSGANETAGEPHVDVHGKAEDHQKVS